MIAGIMSIKHKNHGIRISEKKDKTILSEEPYKKN